MYICALFTNRINEREPWVPFFICANRTMHPEIEPRIAQLLDAKYAEDEVFADCFTVEIALKPGQKLYVFADSDSGMTFEKCQKLSRYLESHLDTNGWLGDKYLLEVSSPGIGRPLKFLRQYGRNIGRTVMVTRKDKTEETGILKSASAETGVVIEREVIEKEGNKKKKVMLEIIVALDDIDKIIVKISF